MAKLALGLKICDCRLMIMSKVRSALKTFVSHFQGAVMRCNKFSNQLSIIKAQSLLFLLLLAIVSCTEPVLVKTEVNSIDVTLYDSIGGDESVEQLIAPYKAKLEAEMNEVLVVSSIPMQKDIPEGKLGNFVADLVFGKCLEKYKADDGHRPDFCLINNGGLRVPLPAGEVTKGKIFELMPFENEIVVITILGQKAKELFEYIAAVGGQPVSNIKMGIEEGKPIDIMIGGKPFDETKSYKVVTSDYLANGGDRMSFFLEPLNRESIAYKIRDAIIDHLREVNAKGEELKTGLDGRIYEHKP